MQMKHDVLLILKRILRHRHEDEIARNVCHTRSGSGQLNEILRRKHVRSLLKAERRLGAMGHHSVIRGFVKRYLGVGESADEAGQRY